MAKAFLASLLGFSIVSGELAIIERVASAAPPKQIDPMSVKGLPDPGAPTLEMGEPNRNSFEQQPKFGVQQQQPRQLQQVQQHSLAALLSLPPR